jgi:acyl-[acyl-carrier-protein]-phospholipid O-acyltransferase/long-chain-fatty-acid--[acyl-carrier-protein] ligase
MLGVRTFCYPTPLHYRTIPELCYGVGATILYATDTFLKGYAIRAHPYDFYKIRYVFTGAEKLKDETQALWFSKFGIRIFEGYGITETGPVIASNTMMHYKPGTVGRFLPMVQHRLEKVEGIEDGNTGRLFVRGPNIMMGYLGHDGKESKLLPPENGWYDTGDIVHIDTFGYVTILGRVKRFAKVAGEMVSLDAIEKYATLMHNQFMHVATYFPHLKKGEMIVLLTECRDLIKHDFIHYYQLNQISMIHVPKAIYYIKSIPRTATGKIDYQAAMQLASDFLAVG